MSPTYLAAVTELANLGAPPRGGAPHPFPGARLAPPWGLGRAALIVMAAAGLALPLRPLVNTIDVAMWFLLAVVVVATRSGRGPSVLASLLAILAFDVLFVPPYYRITVEDTDYLATFAVMLSVALVMSSLTARIREQSLTAARGEWLARARLALTAALDRTTTPEEVTTALTSHIGALLESPGFAVFPLGTSGQEVPAGAEGQWLEDTEVRLAALWAVAYREPAGWGTAHGAAAGALVLPLVTATHGVGILVFPAVPARSPDAETVRLTAEFSSQGAIALDRALIAGRHQAAQLEIAAEQLRTALLSSLSHDLRTPLAGIEGAATSLLAGEEWLSPDDRADLTRGIVSEVRRMHRLVVNLLDMVRVESGTLAVHCFWQPIEEALGVALLRLEERLAGRQVTTDIPTALPLVFIDELLIEQVFVNLLENVVRHTPPDSAVQVSASVGTDFLTVEVRDHGPGIPAGMEEAIFGKFYQVPEPHQRTGSGSGAGLGLAICRGIVRAHGGSIWAEAAPGGGTAFRFTLPLGQAPPPLPVET